MAIEETLAAGHIPPLLRELVPIELRADIDGRMQYATAFVMRDVLAIGDDDDKLRIPMTARVAQRIADAAGCILPTRKIVDATFEHADVKLASPRMPDKSKLATTQYYVTHDLIIDTLLRRRGKAFGDFVAGHKKNVVLSRKLQVTPGRLAIYGWYAGDGRPIQPLSAVHSDKYVDYTHGVRLVHRTLLVGDEPMDLGDVLRDERLHGLVSDEGRFTIDRYPGIALE